MDISSYLLGFLRLDGRRWNDLRRTHARVSTQAAADGSSYLEMGNTKVICTVTGPAEGRRTGGGGGGGAGGGGGGAGGVGGASSGGVFGPTGGEIDVADLRVDVSFAAFSGVDRKKRGRLDKRITEMNHAVATAFESTVLTHLYPRSTITITLHVLSQDGSILAALINATTLALIDAGIPMHDYIAACTAGCMSASVARVGGSSGTAQDDDGSDDPLLDLTMVEEQELPSITVATKGASDQVALLVSDSRFHVSRLEEMLAVGVDGCRRMRTILDSVVRKHGEELLKGGREE